MFNNFKLSGSTFAPHANKLYEKSNIINVSVPERIVSAAAGTAMYVLSVNFKRAKWNTPLRYGGLYLLYRGLSGNCPLKASISKDEYVQHTPAINFRTSLHVNAPRQFVYDTWRDLENLPRFLKHIKKIKVTDEIHSHWVLKTPGRIPTIEWNAEIIDQENGRELSWRSVPGSMIETIGKINFSDTLNATHVSIVISYRPPAGFIGAAIAKFFNPTLKKYIEDDIIRFKKYVEEKKIIKGIS